MEALFATNNPAKIKTYSNKLKEKGINLKSLVDLNINIENLQRFQQLGWTIVCL